MVRNDSQDDRRNQVSLPNDNEVIDSEQPTIPQRGFDLTISREIRLCKLMEREESKERIRKIIEDNTKMTFGRSPSDVD